MRRLFAPSLLLAACGGGVDPVDPPAPIQGPAPLVLPTASAEITLAQANYALPEALRQQPLQVATLPGVSTLVGGQGGLYEATADGLVLIDAAPVVGLATYGERIVVAHPDHVSVWHGTLEPSGLSEALAGRTLSTLGSDGVRLYVGTEEGLEKIEDGRRVHFATMPSPRALSLYEGGAYLVVTDGAGAISALRDGQGVVDQQELTAEKALAQVAPGAGDRLYALADGALLERQPADAGRVRYRAVALSPGAEAGATSLSALATDPSTGFVWAIGAVLARLENGRVSLLPAPAELSSTLNTVTVTVDGALWLSDGVRLVRIGNEGPKVTWPEIQAFHVDNCQRCHAPLGTGHLLETYEAWTAEIDRIVDAVELGRMPQDQRPLIGGTVELLRRWRADGLLR